MGSQLGGDCAQLSLTSFFFAVEGSANILESVLLRNGAANVLHGYGCYGSEYSDRMYALDALLLQAEVYVSRLDFQHSLNWLSRQGTLVSLITIGNQCCLVETPKVKDTYQAQHTDFMKLSQLYVTYNVSFTSPKRVN